MFEATPEVASKLLSEAPIEWHAELEAMQTWIKGQEERHFSKSLNKLLPFLASEIGIEESEGDHQALIQTLSFEKCHALYSSFGTGLHQAKEKAIAYYLEEMGDCPLRRTEELERMLEERASICKAVLEEALQHYYEREYTRVRTREGGSRASQERRRQQRRRDGRRKVADRKIHTISDLS
jgi:hypothetical protein